MQTKHTLFEVDMTHRTYEGSPAFNVHGIYSTTAANGIYSTTAANGHPQLAHATLHSTKQGKKKSKDRYHNDYLRNG